MQKNKKTAPTIRPRSRLLSWRPGHSMNTTNPRPVLATKRTAGTSAASAYTAGIVGSHGNLCRKYMSMPPTPATRTTTSAIP